jgi:sensor histidine kinase YesM
MAVQVLIENAVKHNPENDAFIAIRFSIKDEILFLRIVVTF